MGYTHYWDFKPTEHCKEEFENVIADCKIILANKGDIKICGGDGTGEPEITDEYISINGFAENGLDYETFYFDLHPRRSYAFCKTARRPYDLIVCTILLSLANHMSRFSFSSDGEYVKDEWQPAFAFYKQIGLKFQKGKRQKIISWLK